MNDLKECRLEFLHRVNQVASVPLPGIPGGAPNTPGTFPSLYLLPGAEKLRRR